MESREARQPPPRTFSDALRELGSAQKSPVGVPAYTRFINRPLGRVAAAAAFRLGLTPNLVTAASGALSLASMVLLTLTEPSWVLGLIVAAGLAAGSALDSADGQLARLRGGGSQAGEWLDHVVDAARLPALHLAVLIALLRFSDGISLAILLIPMGYLIISVVRFFALMLAEQMRIKASVTSSKSFAGDSLMKSVALLPLDYGTLCLIFAIWGHQPLFLVVYGALFIVNAALLAVTLRRRYLELAPPA